MAGTASEMLEIVFSVKIESCFFPFYHGPKLSNLVVVMIEETDFSTCYCRGKLYDSKEKMGIGKNLSVFIATVVAIPAVFENGSHCSKLQQSNVYHFKCETFMSSESVLVINFHFTVHMGTW